MNSKPLKLILAFVSLALAIGAFFGGPDLVPQLQAIPLMLRLPIEGTLIVIALTLLFGRLYCEVWCPLGILQSIVAFLRHPKRHVRRVCTRLPSSKPQTIARGISLLTTIALLSCGARVWAWIIEPYSIFARAMSGLLAGVIMLLAILTLSLIGDGRFWCNWICPLGTLFHLLSRFSLCRHQIGPNCANCRRCFPSSSAEPQPEKSAAGITRRKFLSGAGAIALTEKLTDGDYAPVSLPIGGERKLAILPPGATSRRDFEFKCLACGLCIDNCPEHVLRPSVKLSRFGQPELSFEYGACRLACDYRCGKVCPTGALKLLGRVPRKDVHVGRAIWNHQLCLRSQEKFVDCTACIRKCPVDAIKLLDDKKTIAINETICIGCGACEHSCPARPETAIRVEALSEPVITRPIDDSALIKEMTRLIEAKDGPSVVVARDGVIRASEKGHGVKPLLKLMNDRQLYRAVVVDKVIGRAAAAICIVGGASEVHSLTMSRPAKQMLLDHNLKASAEKMVAEILNRDQSGLCPIEQQVINLSSPADIVNQLK